MAKSIIDSSSSEKLASLALFARLKTFVLSIFLAPLPDKKAKWVVQLFNQKEEVIAQGRSEDLAQAIQIAYKNVFQAEEKKI